MTHCHELLLILAALISGNECRKFTNGLKRKQKITYDSIIDEHKKNMKNILFSCIITVMFLFFFISVLLITNNAVVFVFSCLFCFCLGGGGGGCYCLSRLFHSFWAESIIRWGENGRSLRNHKQNLACLTCNQVWDSNPQQQDDKWFKVLKISVLNHSATGADSIQM